MEKDLVNAKTLAALLEDQAATLRKTKIKEEGTKPEDDSGALTSDVDMAAPDPEEEEEEPSERGSDAVERRVEKVMADMREQNLVDVNDEKAYEAQRVCYFLF